MLCHLSTQDSQTSWFEQHPEQIQSSSFIDKKKGVQVCSCLVRKSVKHLHLCEFAAQSLPTRMNG